MADWDPNDPKTWGSGLSGGEYKPVDANEAAMFDAMRAQGGGAQLQQPAAQPGWSDPFATQQAASNNPATLDERGQMVQQAPYFSGLFGTKYQGSANDIGRLAQWGIDVNNPNWLKAGVGAAPIYDLNTDQGRAALDSQQRAAGLGMRYQGMAAFMPDFQARYDQGSLEKDPLSRLGGAFGIDPSGYDLNSQAGLKAYADQVNAQASQYELLGGLSGGFGGSGDAREAFSSLYKNENGKLVPVGDTTMYHAPEKGGWLAEHPAARTAIYGTAAVLAGPWIAAAGGAGAGAGAAEGATAGGGLSGGSTLASGAGGYGANVGAGYLGTAGTGSLGAGIGTAGAYGGGSTLAGSLGAYGGAGLFGPGGITSAMAANYSQGGSSLLDKAKDQALKKVRNEVIKRALGGGANGSPGGSGGLSGGGQGGSGGSGLAGLQPHLGYAQAQEKAWLQGQGAVQTAALRRKLAKKLADDTDEA